MHLLLRKKTKQIFSLYKYVTQRQNNGKLMLLICLLIVQVNEIIMNIVKKIASILL